MTAGTTGLSVRGISNTLQQKSRRNDRKETRGSEEAARTPLDHSEKKRLEYSQNEEDDTGSRYQRFP